MLSDEGMMRAANTIKGAAESMSRSAETANFDTQRIIENMESLTQRIEDSVDKLILYFKEFHR